MTENEITGAIVDSALKIHRDLGPGLLESVYETVLAYELAKRRLKAVRQHPIPIVYEQMSFADPFRADLMVEDRILVELKSVESVLPLHRKQLLTYLRLSRLHLGLLINFNVPLLKDGIDRLVNGFE